MLSCGVELFCFGQADAVDVAVAEAMKMTVAPTEAELKRAKLQLQSMIHFNLEARALQFEDIGSQVLTTGAHQSAQALSQQIDKVWLAPRSLFLLLVCKIVFGVFLRLPQITAADVARVAKAMVSSPVTYVVSGEKLTAAPRYDQVAKKFL